MKLDERVTLLRESLVKDYKPAVPDSLQGVTKERIRQVLGAIALGDNPDLVDGVFALLDNMTLSWFSNAPKGATFTDGASTAHLACHVGILQRGQSKLDREGRDYWIKPLRQLGGIEPIFLNARTVEFIPGHPVAKSPNSAYRLPNDFKEILRANDADWQGLLKTWIDKDAIRQRRELQAKLAEQSRALVDTKHSDLINASIEHYVPNFLPAYEVVYVDDGDGDRITDEDRERFQEAGIVLKLDDAMPDILLWNRETNWLWIIEAVTSDGEVDIHKAQQLRELAKRCGKTGIGFTTTYGNWRDAAVRQSAHKNLAVDTYVWIQDDPGKHFLAVPFPSK